MTTFKAAATAPVKVQTTNGAVAFDHSGDANLDFFGSAGSMRKEPAADIVRKFHAAWSEDKTTALVNAFHLRDVRGGMGERNAFIQIMLHLEKTQPEAFMGDVVSQMAEYGRWSDMLQFKTPAVKKMVYEQFRIGIFVNENGLAAKWAPRRGPKMKEFRDFLGVKNSTYRKVLRALTDVVEQKMCAQQWDQIDYSKLPSMAARRYQKTFERHDAKRYNAWALKAAKGEVKVNAGAIMPHEVLYGPGNANTKQAQWDALPNFIPEGSRVIPMIDVSGSMTWFKVDNNADGLKVAVALGMYVAEKNTGAFKNLVLPFASKPQFYDLSRAGASVTDRANFITRMDVGMSTNIEAAYKLILQTAIRHNVPQEEMPTSLLIFSDMQFNQAVQGSNKSTYANIRKQFKDAGYKCPNLIFWNLDGRYKQSPVKADSSGAALVSGYSPALCKSVLDSTIKDFTPRNVMIKALGADRYEPIRSIAAKHFA